MKAFNPKWRLLKNIPFYPISVSPMGGIYALLRQAQILIRQSSVADKSAEYSMYACLPRRSGGSYGVVARSEASALYFRLP